MANRRNSPYPWHSQITAFGDPFRWLTPRELARLQGIPDSIPVPADRFHAYAAIGDALPPLAAGLFLARAVTRLKTVPDTGPQWEETWVRKWTRATTPPARGGPQVPRQTLACAFCGGHLIHGSLCQCAQTRDLGPRGHLSCTARKGFPLAIVILPRSASHLLWTQDGATGIWTLPYARLDPETPTPDAVREVLGQAGWAPTTIAFHWVLHPAHDHDMLSLIFLRSSEWYHPRPFSPHPTERGSVGPLSSQMINRLGLFLPQPPFPHRNPAVMTPTKHAESGRPRTRAQVGMPFVLFAWRKLTPVILPSTPGAPTPCTNPATKTGSPAATVSARGCPLVALPVGGPFNSAQANISSGTQHNTPSRCWPL